MKGYNDCLNAAAGALRFLAEHSRPQGGEQHYNSLHLHQIADNLTYQAGKPDSERVSELLRFNNEFEERARIAERALKMACAALTELTTPRPIDEYHEDMGDVLWWKLDDKGNPTEPPYCGSPNCLGQEVVIRMPTVGHCTAHVDRDFSPNAMKPRKIKNPGGTFFVGGWPGYHTHWTPLPKVVMP